MINYLFELLHYPVFHKIAQTSFLFLSISSGFDFDLPLPLDREGNFLRLSERFDYRLWHGTPIALNIVVSQTDGKFRFIFLPFWHSSSSSSQSGIWVYTHNYSDTVSTQIPYLYYIYPDMSSLDIWMPYDGQNLEIRAQKGKKISETHNGVIRLEDTIYKVQSQSQNTYYQVTGTEKGWICSCPDSKYRGVKCKHIWAVDFSFAIRRTVQKDAVVIAPVSISNCPKCKSDKIKKAGLRHNKYGAIQKYQCRKCSYWFTINLGFEHMKHNPQAITSAMQL